MSAKEKVNQKRSALHVPRSKSVSSKPTQPQTRTRAAVPPAAALSSSSAVYKTNSEVSLVERLSKLNIKDDENGARARAHKIPPRSTSANGLCRTIEDMARCITHRRAKNIIVMAGAGISTPSGIPDFRTPGTGLYDNLKQYNIPKPEAIFDIDYFENNPRPFYTLAKEIFPDGRYKPNYIHYFIRLLHEKGLLLRVYTQNIDGLERMAGIPVQKLVEAHGNFQSVSCVRCDQKHNCEQIQNAIFANKLPRCMKNGCMGLVKPDIVFFGEDLPRRFYYYLKDFPQADLLIVMGTSLEVEPFAGIVDSVRSYVPRTLFNRNVVGPFKRKKRMNDVFVQGDIIKQLKTFVDLLGWGKDMKALLPGDLEDKPILDKAGAESEPRDQPSDATSVAETACSEPSLKTKVSSAPSLTSLGRTQPHSTQSAARDTGQAKLTKRQTLPKPLTRNVKQDIALVNRMVQANSVRRGITNKPVTKHEPQVIDASLKPRVGTRTVPFHAQRRLLRSNNPRLVPESDSSSSQSDSSSGDEE